MGNLKHTQGEWELRMTSPSSKKGTIGIKNSITNLILNLEFHERDKEEIQANAKLIELAPELLEALIEIKDFMERQFLMIDLLKNKEYIKITNVINKATK